MQLKVSVFGPRHRDKRRAESSGKTRDASEGRQVSNFGLVFIATFIMAALALRPRCSALQAIESLDSEASNYSAVFVDHHNADPTSTSGARKLVVEFDDTGKEETVEPEEDERAEDEDYEEDEDEDENEEFYRQNPAAGLDFSLHDIKEPTRAEKSAGVTEDFDDFDDFDALGLGNFFADGKQGASKSGSETNSAKNKAPFSHLSNSSSLRVEPIRESSLVRRRRKKKVGIGKLSSASGRSKHKHTEQVYKPSASGDNVANSDRCAMPLSGVQGGCLTFSMIEWALTRARRLLGDQQVASGRSAGSATRPPSQTVISSLAEIIELATRLLAIRYSLSASELASGLEQVEVRQTSLWRQCPPFYRAAVASAGLGSAAGAALCAEARGTETLLARFRTHSGRCNNLAGLLLGASHMPFARMLAPAYSDSVGLPRGFNSLPPARLVSLTLHSLGWPYERLASADHSALFANWGQLVNHDLALAGGAGESSGHSGACCRKFGATTSAADLMGLGAGSTRLRRACWPIELPANDPNYRLVNLSCHEFKRSIGALRPGCSLGARSQINLVTSFVDASFVYGSSATEARSLRTGATGGRLATWNYFRQLKPLLPPQRRAPDADCVGRPRGLFCFRSGDARTNQHLPLVLLHTLHTRQHNRLAAALQQVNAHWNDERVYHEARHLHIALVQHILISEYLPLLIGPELVEKYDLVEAPDSDYWDNYEPQLNPAISQEFAAAAFRQGHSSVPSLVFRLSAEGRRRVYPLRQLFRQPWPLFEPLALDEFMLGLLETPSQLVDQFVSAELAGHLLEEPGERVGLDLVAINIQRGRDQGVADYNSMREWCGLERAGSFDDLAKWMPQQTADQLASLYTSVDEIDLYTGGLSELPADAHSQVGPTFACIIGRQFQTLRAADRFWFESSAGPHAFTPEQLRSIKQVTLARLICANSDRFERAPDHETIQVLAMRLPHPVLNPRVPCGALPDVDILAWREQLPVAAQQASTGDGEDEEAR